MEQTWRWYGPSDPVSLDDIKQAGATGIVTALHHIPNGHVWTVEEILERKTVVEEKGLSWSVVESVPVHEEIKTRTGDYKNWVKNYKQSLMNLAECGIRTVCYNFMPVLDWTRTDLEYKLSDGSRSLRFDQVAFSAFDLFVLKRSGAKAEYSHEDIQLAEAYFDQMSSEQVSTLTENIIAGVPGAEEGYTLDEFLAQLSIYDGIDTHTLRQHMAAFLSDLIPTCEKMGIRLAVHPDDPPRSLFGLPRIISTLEDLDSLFDSVPSMSNGITMCTGSYGVRDDNNLLRMIKKHGKRVYFAHLRAIKREANSLSFYESNHLDGDVDMCSVVRALLEEESRRLLLGQPDPIPMRPDHGHQMIDDLKKKTNPGYSCIGRLRGLAEIRGIERALKKMLGY